MQISPPLSVFDQACQVDSPEGTYPYPDSASTTTTSSASSGVRQRSSSSSSDSSARQAKRQRRHDLPPTPPLSNPSADVLDHWRRMNELPNHLPLTSGPQLHAFQPILDDLEYSAAWGSQPPPSALDSFLRAPLPSSHLPTPESTTHASFAPARPAAPLRAATAPLSSSASLTAKALALKAGVTGSLAGLPRELRAGEPIDVDGPPPMRRSTAPSPGEGASQKDRFVAGLVGASVIAIESIWGVQTSPEDSATSPVDSSVLPLQWFVREVLRRSRTSCSTLQVSLYYLHKCRREIRETVARAEAASFVGQSKPLDPTEMDAYPSPPHTPVDSLPDMDRFGDNLPSAASAPSQANNPILCGRRMFLASLIAASKFLQDRNYSNRAWAKISGLPVQEINDNERVFLGLMGFQLHLGADDFHKWTERLASLASQGAALESAAVEKPSRARMGLARHATEYPQAEPLDELRPSVPGVVPRPRTTILGRTHSDPEMAARSVQPYLCSSATHASRFLSVPPRHHQLTPKLGHSLLQINLPKLPARPSTLRQVASPAETEVSASSSSPESTPSPPDEWVGRRKIAPISKARLTPRPSLEIPVITYHMDVCGGASYASGENVAAWARGQSVQAH